MNIKSGGTVLYNDAEYCIGTLSAEINWKISIFSQTGKIDKLTN